MNGKMDLSQAEAVMDVIQAKNEYALKSSMSQLKGSVQKTIKEIRSDLIYEIAFIESAWMIRSISALRDIHRNCMGSWKKSRNPSKSC